MPLSRPSIVLKSLWIMLLSGRGVQTESHGLQTWVGSDGQRRAASLEDRGQSEYKTDGPLTFAGSPGGRGPGMGLSMPGLPFLVFPTTKKCSGQRVQRWSSGGFSHATLYNRRSHRGNPPG